MKFILVCPPRELFVVRWSVFLLGPAGCGKTAVWRTLMKAQLALGEKTIYRCVSCIWWQESLLKEKRRRSPFKYETWGYVEEWEWGACWHCSSSPLLCRPINPKSVTRNELYGYLHPATREWKEGLMSVTFRDMSNNKVRDKRGEGRGMGLDTINVGQSINLPLLPPYTHLSPWIIYFSSLLSNMIRWTSISGLCLMATLMQSGSSPWILSWMIIRCSPLPLMSVSPSHRPWGFCWRSITWYTAHQQLYHAEVSSTSMQRMWAGNLWWILGLRSWRLLSTGLCWPHSLPDMWMSHWTIAAETSKVWCLFLLSVRSCLSAKSSRAFSPRNLFDYRTQVGLDSLNAWKHIISWS